jgi:hypothetical protein
VAIAASVLGREPVPGANGVGLSLVLGRTGLPVAQGFDTGPRVSVSSAHSSQIKQAVHPPSVYSYSMPISVPPQTGHGLGSIIVALPGARPKLAYWSCHLASAARTPAGPPIHMISVARTPRIVMGLFGSVQAGLPAQPMT